MQEVAVAIASGTQAGYIELLHYRLCGILPFQDMRSMYGRGVLFVPGTRCGGVRKAFTVWRQVATARGPESSAAKSVQGTSCGADNYVSHEPIARAITETSEVSPYRMPAPGERWRAAHRSSTQATAKRGLTSVAGANCYTESLLATLGERTTIVSAVSTQDTVR